MLSFLYDIHQTHLLLLFLECFIQRPLQGQQSRLHFHFLTFKFSLQLCFSFQSVFDQLKNLDCFHAHNCFILCACHFFRFETHHFYDLQSQFNIHPFYFDLAYQLWFILCLSSLYFC